MEIIDSFGLGSVERIRKSLLASSVVPMIRSLSRSSAESRPVSQNQQRNSGLSRANCQSLGCHSLVCGIALQIFHLRRMCWGLNEPRQPTLAFDDETDNVEDVFDPGDCDETDDEL